MTCTGVAASAPSSTRQALSPAPPGPTKKLGVTKQAAGRIDDDLEKRGCAERRPHPAGGRRGPVVLTDRAQTHLPLSGRILHELEAQLSERLRAADLEVPRAELATMIRALARDTVPPLRPLW
ncbi:hypothetical protein [Streptomyces sp. NPDC055058]